MSDEAGGEEEGGKAEAREQVLELAKRHTDHQISQINTIDSKVGRLLSFAALALAAGGSLIYREAPIAILAYPTSLLGAGLLLNIAGGFMLLVPYIGMVRDIPSFPGPRPEWYKDRVAEEDWRTKEVQESLVKSFSTSISNNDASLESIKKFRNRGFYLVLASLPFYTAFAWTV